MTSLDPSLVRGAFTAFDTLIEDSVRLARADVPGLFQRGAAKELKELARAVQVESLDAAKAVELLELPRSATRTGPLREAVEGVRAARMKPSDQVHFGMRIHDAAIEAREHASSGIGRLVDDQLRALLKTPPRDLPSKDAATLRALLEVREAAAVRHPTVATYVTTAGLGSTAADLVEQLHEAHLVWTGATTSQMTARVEELLAGRATVLDPIDAAELRVLVRQSPDVASQLPRNLGDADVDGVLSRVVAGEATTADHRVLRAFDATMRDDVDELRSVLHEVLDGRVDSLDAADYRTLSTLLEAAPAERAIGMPADRLRTVAGDAGSAAAGQTMPHLPTELHRVVAGLDGLADDAAKVDSAIADTLATPLDELDADAWSRLRAYDQIAGEHGTRPTVGIPTSHAEGDVLAAAAGGAPDHDALRLAAAWKQHVSGHVPDAAARERMLAELLDGAELPGPADRARLHLLMDADAADGTNALSRNLGDDTDIDDVLRSASEDLPRVLERWRMDLDGTLDDPARLRAAADQLLQRPAEELTPRDWARLDALARAAGVSESHATTLRDVATGALDASDATTIGAFEAIRTIVDGTADDIAARRGAIHALVERDLEELGTADWARLRALVEADGSAAAPIGITRQLDDLVPADELLESMVDGHHVTSATERYVASWQATVEGLADDPDALRTAFSAQLDRDPTTFTRRDWARMHALFDVELATGTLGLKNRSVEGVTTADVIASLARGDRTVDGATRRILTQWRIHADGLAQDPEKLRNRIAVDLARDHGSFGADDWARLDSLVQLHDELGNGFARSIPGVEVADEVFGTLAAGTRELDDEARRYLDLWKLEAGSPTPQDLATRISDFARRDTTDLTSDDWRAIRTLIDHDAASGTNSYTTNLPGAVVVSDVLASLIDETRPVGTNARRYLMRWGAEADGLAGSPRDVTTRTQQLLATGEPGSADEWVRRRTLFDLDQSATKPRLTGTLGETTPANELLERLGDGDLDALDEMRRYLVDWEYALDGTTASTAKTTSALKPLLERPADQLEPLDWQRLRTLVHGDAATNELGLATSIDGVASAEDVLLRRAFGTDDALPAERYLDLWRAQLDGTASDAAAMRSRLEALLARGDGALDGVTTDADSMRREVDELLVAIQDGSLDAAGADRLQRLLDADQASGVLGLVRRLGKDARAHEAIQSGEQLDRFAAAWAAQLDGSADAAASRMRAYVDREIDTIDTSEWNSIRQILDLDAAGTQRLATSLDGVGHASSLIDDAASGNPNLDELRRYLVTWQVQTDDSLADPAAFRSTVRNVLDAPVDERTSDDWQRLLALVDADQQLGHVGLSDALVLYDRSDLQTDLGRGGGAVAETFDRVWRLQADGSFDDAARLREHLLTTVLHKKPAELTRADWGVLRQVLDLDERTGMFGLTRSRAGLPDFVETAELYARGKSRTFDVRPATNQRGAGMWDIEGNEHLVGSWRLDLGTGYALTESAALRDGKLAAHMIRRADVDGFLADSQVRQTLFHGSSNATTHRHIIERGPLVEKNKRSALGQGFYNSVLPGGWGQESVEVAVRTRKPLVVDDVSQLETWVAANGGRGKYRDAYRDIVRAQGYDSIIVKAYDDGNGDWVIGLENDKIKLVVEDAAGAIDERGPALPLLDRSFLR